MMRFYKICHFNRHCFQNSVYLHTKSCEIRQNFLEYFVQQEHKIVRSSPVVPFCDPTVAFVNAGMNQFKSIFLGKSTPRHDKVVNSQKCIRVGGKHNDLQIVGTDGYHHTFFEMLGNWSFGDYFKREAQTMALDLLRNVYGIEMSRLYFTYFAGNDKLNIPADMECYEIWRDLGVPKNRVIPFGMSENFWEMGATGPCGPCTEIHIDHLLNVGNRSNLVNAGQSDLTELWNIVFIQYNREEDGTVTNLPKKHIDTGMGLERLCAILQNKSSNYDTDLFNPIFNTINKETEAPAYTGSFQLNTQEANYDTAYRILADHSRMITACLSDGMLPDQNQKLRRIMRTCFQISEQVFKNEDLLNKIVPTVVDILGTSYPEMHIKLNDTLEIIYHEQEVFKALRLNSIRELQGILKEQDLRDFDLIDNPGFFQAYKELKSLKSSFSDNTIPGSFLYKLHDTYGLNEESMQKLALLEQLNTDMTDFKNELQKVKQKTKSLLYSQGDEMHKKFEESMSKLSQTCSNTDDSFKYNYKFNSVIEEYETEPIKSQILGIIKNGEIIKSKCAAHDEDVICIITDKSNFYYESGGQEGDKGVLKITMNGSCMNNTRVEFLVDDVKFMNNNTIHIGKFQSPNVIVSVGDDVEHLVDRTHRTRNIMHHTSTHLLNAAVRHLFKKVTYQVSSTVNNQNLKLELGVIGRKIDRDDLPRIEELIRNVISHGVAVTTIKTKAEDVIYHSDITLVPGEIYPEDGLRLLEIIDNNFGFSSKELCCGTHIHNTKDLKNFCITNFKQTNRARYAFAAVAGNLADEIINLSKIYEKRVNKLQTELEAEQDKHILVELELQRLKNQLLHSNTTLPYLFKIDLSEKINNILKKIKDSARITLKEFVDIEMQTVLKQQRNEPFVIHFLDSSTLLESVPLQKATKLCTDRPIMVISLNNSMVRARCCVPRNLINSEFNAKLWLNEFACIFNAQIGPPKGRNSSEVCNMKAKRVISPMFEDQLEIAIDKASKYAKSKM
ncbi:alanine--tRNA ligase, mitochondrial [Condylostylus longicornis]|uniref:alanine--tRNA ligase, mitochondrial n=1 Tax=Condylostylus longicornis TaxID=2530218 RepID=UPI00244E3B4D|nr:alanine--tRNA ligase, mitochondrial [Condylostylus longicornis]